MFVALVAALALALAAPQPPLDPQVAAVIAPVRAVYERLDRAQSELPTTADDARRRERLKAMQAADREARETLKAIDFTVLPPDRRAAARAAAWAEIDARSQTWQAGMKALLPPLETAAQSLVEQVRAAYAKVEREQAALPPAASDSERLERMFATDQAGRQVLRTLDFSALDGAQRQAAQAAVWEEIGARDLANREALKSMLPADGWFSKERFSPKARYAAFLIVQHATDDRALMADVLQRLEPLVGGGDIDGPSFAMLYDRVALQDGRPQRYGSQMTCRDTRWVVDTLEDPDGVDARRKAIGFPDTLAQYSALFAAHPPCG